jgi:hypothetical protein
MRRALPNELPSLSSSLSGRQAIDSSHALRQESSSLPADPEYISITTLWPHEPDLPPSSSSTSQDGLLHALGYTQVENIYGVERFQPSTPNAPNSPRVVHTTGHETLAFLSSTAAQQALPLQFDYERCLPIAKFREDHEGAITFDDVDNEEFFLCLDPPTGCRRYSPPPILETSPESVPGDMDLPFYDWDEVFDSNPPPSKELDPAAPAFEYQPSHAYIQDTATGADQQALQSQDSISELPEPELPAETSSAPAPGPDQQALQSQDPVSQSPESELPTQALSAPALQSHAPQQRRLPRLRDLPHYHEVRREEAELRAQRQRQRNGNGYANGNGIARSQRSQNGNATFGPSQGPYRPTRSNGFMATATPSRGSSGSSHSMALGSHNGSSRFSQTRNGPANPPAASTSSWAPKPRSNPPSPTRSGPSKAPQTGSNSSRTTATTDAGLPTNPTPYSSPPYKFKDTAGPSNYVERPATPGPSREPTTNPATRGKARAYTKAASPPRSPPAPTTGTVGVPAAATRPRGGGARAKSWRQSPPAQAAEGSTTTGQISSAAPRSPTQVPTQTTASNGTADAGPSTEGSSVPAEPARISHQESAVTTQPPMPQPTPTSTGGGVADAGPSTGRRSAQVNFTGRDWGRAIFEEQMESYRRSKSMGEYKK